MLIRSNIVACGRFSGKLIKSLSVSTLLWLCVQGAFATAPTQAKDAPFPDTHNLGQSTESVAARLSAQNALFRHQYEDDLRASPESETARGDYRDNSLLDDYSAEASMKQNATDRAYRAKLEAIFTEGFPEQVFCRTICCFTFWMIGSRTTR
jgi:hypothetical protein